MATPAEQLAASLATLEQLQTDGRRVFQSSELSRVHRERLVRSGFLREVTRGWLVAAQPADAPGSSTSWYASFWEFCVRYCDSRFGSQWHLSPEQSLLLYAESTAVPKQTAVYAPSGSNNTLQLPFDTSILDIKEANLPPASDVTERDGLRLFTDAAALRKVSTTFFTRHPMEARIVLAGIGDASALLRPLIGGGHTTIAGRLAGAFRAIGRTAIADDVVKGMRAAGHNLRESNPFEDPERPAIGHVARIPISYRLEALWQEFRGQVEGAFPAEPGLPTDRSKYLKVVDDEYGSDAYHSLSIEGYRVTPTLIDQVRSGAWDPDSQEADRQVRDALAARGYWEAFQLVRQSVQETIAGADAAALVRDAHQDWYRALFQPSVTSGLIPASALAGYRHNAVYLRGSRHVPPRHDVVPDAVETLFELLANEPQATVRAVLGHWLLGYVHPYPDGNGRLARFLMNVMLASGGYPWTVIRVDDRNAYMATLEAASVDQDIRPFATFIADNVTQQGRPDE